MRQNINFFPLLPQEKKAGYGHSQFAKVWGYFLLVCLLVSGLDLYRAHRASLQISVLQHNLANARSALQTLVGANPDLRQGDARALQSVLEEMKYLRIAVSSTPDLPAVLHDLSTIVPAGVWLTQISISGNRNDAGEDISLRGGALFPADVQQFLHALSVSPVFGREDFRLADLTQMKVTKPQTTRFVAFHIVTGAAPG